MHAASMRHPHPRPLPARGRGGDTNCAGLRPFPHQYLEACSSMSEISADILPGSRSGASGGMGAGQAEMLARFWQ